MKQNEQKDEKDKNKDEIEQTKKWDKTGRKRRQDKQKDETEQAETEKWISRR